jgi:hypothetical protein
MGWRGLARRWKGKEKGKEEGKEEGKEKGKEEGKEKRKEKGKEKWKEERREVERGRERQGAEGHMASHVFGRGCRGVRQIPRANGECRSLFLTSLYRS